MTNLREDDVLVEISRLSENSIKLRDETEFLKSDVDKMQQLVQELNRCWQGEAKQQFINGMHKDVESLNQVVEYLEKISKDFEYALNTYIQCENSVYDAVNAIKI